MPLDDAVSYILTSFRKYVTTLKEKASIAADRQPSPDRASDTFLPASPDVSYLIKLLADNRNLTVEELNTIIQYLEKRRDKLIDPRSQSLTSKEKSPSARRSADNNDNSSESRRRSPENRHRSLEKGRKSPEVGHRGSVEAGNRRSLEGGRGRSPEEGYRKSPQSYRRSPAMDLEEVSQSPKAEATGASEAPSLLTEDLKSKILNILNSMRNTQSKPAADVEQPQPMFPAAVSTTASLAPVSPPPPLPSSLPLHPANEFNNSGAQDSTNVCQNSSGFVNNANSGFVDSVQGSSSTSAALGASNFPSSFATGNEDGYQQGAWQGGGYDQNTYNQGGYDQSTYNQGAYDQSTYNQGAYDQGTYDQGAWMQGAEQNWGMQPEMGQTATGTTGAPFQEAYNYPGRNNQMGQMRNNYGQPRY